MKIIGFLHIDIKKSYLKPQNLQTYKTETAQLRKPPPLGWLNPDEIKEISWGKHWDNPGRVSLRLIMCGIDPQLLAAVVFSF